MTTASDDRDGAAVLRDTPPEPTQSGPSLMEVETIMARQDDRSLGEMFGDLTRDFKTLVHQEVQLAKVELGEKASTMRKGVVLVVGGGLLAYGAFLTVVAAIVLALIATGLPSWVAALIAAVVLGAIGYLFIHSGITSLRPQHLNPHHTIDTLKEDAQWLRTRVKS